jgi:hypothetical protein
MEVIIFIALAIILRGLMNAAFKQDASLRETIFRDALVMAGLVAVILTAKLLLTGEL